MKLSEMPKGGEESKTSSKQKNINETYEELKGCSSDELMNRLVNEIQSQKNSGVFDYDSLLGAIEKIKQYLPATTYENMLKIIESLK